CDDGRSGVAGLELFSPSVANALRTGFPADFGKSAIANAEELEVAFYVAFVDGGEEQESNCRHYDFQMAGNTEPTCSDLHLRDGRCIHLHSNGRTHYF